MIIAIENKIKKDDRGDQFITQLTQEYQYLRERLNVYYGDPQIPILFIFLIPDQLEGYHLEQWNNLEITNGIDKKIHYSWKEINEQTPAVSTILKNLIIKVNCGEINPPSSHSNLFLKSMYKFISHDFKTEKKYYEDNNENNNENIIIENENDFWDQWSFGQSREFAEFIKNIASDFFGNDNVTFKKTRVVFFDDDVKSFRIMNQPPTNQNRVAIQIKLNTPELLDDLINELCNLGFVYGNVGNRDPLLQIIIPVTNDNNTRNSITNILENLLENTVQPIL